MNRIAHLPSLSASVLMVRSPPVRPENDRDLSLDVCTVGVKFGRWIGCPGAGPRPSPAPGVGPGIGPIALSVLCIWAGGGIGGDVAVRLPVGSALLRPARSIASWDGSGGDPAICPGIGPAALSICSMCAGGGIGGDVALRRPVGSALLLPARSMAS